MLNKYIVGAVALVIAGGAAYAQTAQPTPPVQNDQGQAMQNDDQNQDGQNMNDGQNQGWWGGHWRHHGHGHGGMRGMMGQGGPGMGGPGMGGAGKMAKAGFRMTLGNGVNVAVMCGNEAMKDCIAEAQPLIDAAKSAATAQPAAKTP